MLKKCKLLLLSVSLALSSYNIYAATLLSESSLDKDVLNPTKRYNLYLRIDENNGQEIYQIYDRLTGNSKIAIYSNQQLVDSYDAQPLSVKTILDPNGSRIYPEIDKQYYTCVSIVSKPERICQYFTGKNSTTNCVPACISMACNWVNGEDSNIQPEYIRSLTGKKEEGYNTKDTEQALSATDLKYTRCTVGNVKTLIKYLNQGKIILALIQPNYISLSTNMERTIGISAHGDGNTGHAVLITGYVNYYDAESNKEYNYFQVLDPADLKIGTRYFVQSETSDAIRFHTDDYFVIER